MNDPLPPGLTWAHSFEEDEGGVQVYRPEQGFAFPPSRRGRETLSFDAAGQPVAGAPGPDDRVRASGPAGAALGMNRFRIGDRVLEIVEAGPELLKVRWG